MDYEKAQLLYHQLHERFNKDKINLSLKLLEQLEHTVELFREATGEYLIDSKIVFTPKTGHWRVIKGDQQKGFAALLHRLRKYKFREEGKRQRGEE